MSAVGIAPRTPAAPALGRLLLAASLLLGVPAVASAFDAGQLTQLKRTNQCHGCDLSGVDLHAGTFAGLDVRRANLHGANLSEATLWKATFQDAALANANLRGADLREANFRNANLRNADLRDASLAGAELEGADLTGAVGATADHAAATRPGGGLPRLWAALTSCLLAVLAGALVLAAARPLADDRLLWRIVVAAFLVRLVATVVLYATSAALVPVAETQQLGNGWWLFAADSGANDLSSRRVLEAWRLGTSLPEMAGEKSMAVIGAALYWLLGAHLLHAEILGALCGGLIPIVTARLCRSLGARRAAVIAATALVGFWPSLVLWSTQFIKDPLVILLTLVEVSLIGGLWSSCGAAARRRPLAWLAAGVVSVPLVFLRNYALATVTLAIVAFVPALAGPSWRKVLTRAIPMVIVVGAPGWLASHVELGRIAAPWRVERGDMRMGLAAHRLGDLAGALRWYDLALREDPAYTPGLRNSAGALACIGRLGDADKLLRRYLMIEPSAAPADVRTFADTIEERLRSGGAPAGAAGDLCARLDPVDDVAPLSVADVLGTKLRLAAVYRRLGALPQGPAVSPLALGRATQFMIREAGPEAGTPMTEELPPPPTASSRVTRGLVAFYLFPFVDGAGLGTSLAAAAALESVLGWLLLVALVLSLRTLLGRRDPVHWYLVLCVATLTGLLVLVIPNAGTLFRLRLQPFVLTIVLVALAGGLERLLGLAPAAARALTKPA